MGAPFNSAITTWSDGSYAFATNFEDDLAIITRPQNFDFRADETGSNYGTALPLPTTTLGNGDRTVFQRGYIHVRTDVDAYHFSLSETEGINFQFQTDAFFQNLNIEARLYNSKDQLITSVNLINNVNSEINFSTLIKGDYYVTVDGVGTPGEHDYGSLGYYEISGLISDHAKPFDDNYEPNNTAAAADDPIDNGGLWSGTPLSAIDGRGIANDDDWYTLTVGVTSTLTVDLTFLQAGGDLDLELWNGDGTALLESGVTASDNESVQRIVLAGTYLVRVTPFASVGNSYDLVWNAVALGTDGDAPYEENDVPVLATDPKSNGGNWENEWLSEISGLGNASDIDWFLINVEAGKLQLRVEALFEHAEGDIDIEIWDLAGENKISGSASLTDNEQIDFALPAAGQYLIRVIPYSGTGNTYDLRFTNKDAATLTSIRGEVWNDSDRNGIKNSFEPGIGGRTVYLDANGNGALDTSETSTMTDVNGIYLFEGIAVGAQTIRTVLPGGWELTAPAAIFHTVDVVAGTPLTNLDFGTRQLDLTGGVSGRIWDDLDDNDFQTAVEPGLEGVRVFADRNGNGAIDDGDQVVFTNAAGDYVFEGLALGTYTVTATPPDGYELLFQRSKRLLAGQNLILKLCFLTTV